MMKNRLLIKEDPPFKTKEKIKTKASFTTVKKIRHEQKRATKLVIKQQKRKYQKLKRYEAYLSSQEWYWRKNRYYQTHKRQCAICETKKNITLHHKVYSHLGRERDDELVPLCKSHHDEYHATYKNTSKETTHQFIEDKRKQLLAEEKKVPF